MSRSKTRRNSGNRSDRSDNDSSSKRTTGEVDGSIEDQVSREVSDTASPPERVEALDHRWARWVAGGYLLRQLAFFIFFAGSVLALGVAPNFQLIIAGGLLAGMIVSFLVLPVALYKDIQQLGDTEVEWSPRRWFYVGGAVVIPPPSEAMIVTMYLIHRRRATGRPRPGHWILQSTASVRRYIH